MGLILCEICDCEIGWDSLNKKSIHQCKPEDIKEHIETLKNRARNAESNLEKIRNCVFKLLTELPDLSNETATLKSTWLRNLWDAAQCNWYNAQTIDDFLVEWLTYHRILCDAFSLFRKKKDKTLKDKLEALKKSCDNAIISLGYKDSKFDLEVKDLLNEQTNQ